MITAGWEVVYHSDGGLVTNGPFGHVRRHQYTGIFIITLAFIFQWPSLAMLILWPFVF